MDFHQGEWIECALATERDTVVVYKKSFSLRKKVAKAELFITACGVYCAILNGKRISEPLAPGFDSYPYRMPYQKYDVTDCLGKENTIRVSVGRGWYGWWHWDSRICENSKNRRMKACFFIEYQDGTQAIVPSDDSWTACLGQCERSDIYDGEAYNATLSDREETNARAVETDLDGLLILSDGEKVCEHERLKPVSSFLTPKGEFVIDFGQNLTGYIEFSITAKANEALEISHAEILDGDGNFYTENYRSAKAKIYYICKDGKQEYKPQHTFFGFRYIRLDKKPETVKAEDFTAIVVHSDIKRTGYIQTSNSILNRFFENVIWGQKDNFLDVPTDCPQRDERQGWTGDAQVFCRAATYNFDCEKFFARWLRMLRLEQTAHGFVPTIVPDTSNQAVLSAGWGDAATVCPWQVYQTYGNAAILREQFQSMQAHVRCIGTRSKKPYLWFGNWHFGDWLGLDAPEGSYTGSSDKDFIASAFYAYSTSLVIKAGEVLGENVDEYKTLYAKIRQTFLSTFPQPKTQTECALALYFGLTDDKEKTAKRLVDLIKNCGNHLQTGFIGTPYLLHALSENGYTEVAYELLLREEYPSWLYSVKQGATTVWEHWDGKNEQGEFWSADMNSFNHYAYGAAVDWLYSVAGGITPEKAGFEKIRIAPKPSKTLDWLQVRLDTRKGKVAVKWQNKDGKTVYEIETPTDTSIVIGSKSYEVKKGCYIFEENE
ncbi:MAG: family 78 glycoside hydrolase catalytic domain [Clostridia bacterium]|nr:family 78 glycoside hydrolase catalytic domain [Clostridia bacterium]